MPGIGRLTLLDNDSLLSQTASNPIVVGSVRKYEDGRPSSMKSIQEATIEPDLPNLVS